MWQRAEIAVEDRRRRDDHEQPAPFLRHERHGREQHAQQENKARRLGTHGEECRRRCGRALIHVRCPHLERNHRDLEAKPDEQEQQAEEEQFVLHKLWPCCREIAKVERAARPKDERNAEHHERRGQRAHDEILHARFERTGAATLKADEHIERHGDEFERDEQQREVIRRRREHHARSRKQDERVILRDARRDAIGELHRHQQDKNRRDEEKAFEEQRRAVEKKHSFESRFG